MRGLRVALLVMTATGLVLASRFVVFARDTGTVISACVQNANGSIRIITSGGCKNSESLMQWNQQGPPGPMGPAAPGTSNGPAVTGALHVIDSQGTTVGDWQSPGYVSLTINAETVFIGLDLAGQTFMAGSPTFYYTDSNCANPPMMFLDMTHYGVVQGGVVYYPTGGLASKSFLSLNSGGGCVHAGGSGTFANVATANVGSFVAPFALSH